MNSLQNNILLNIMDLYLNNMNKDKAKNCYIARLADVAWEKSLNGDEDAAFYYFGKAIEAAISPDDYVVIAMYVQKADLPENKALAYGVFTKALESAKDPVKFFRHLVHRKDLVSWISEYVVKMPDDLFHLLMRNARDTDQITFLCSFFRPFANFITDPAPDSILGDAA